MTGLTSAVSFRADKAWGLRKVSGVKGRNSRGNCECWQAVRGSEGPRRTEGAEGVEGLMGRDLCSSSGASSSASCL